MPMSWKRWKNRQRIKAFLDVDIEDFLCSLGVLEAVQQGDVRCLCNEVVTVDNIQAVIPTKDGIVFSCDLCLDVALHSPQRDQ